MRRAPSLKSLEHAFPTVERSSLVKVRKCIHQGKGMTAIDRHLDNHGVECVYDKHGAIVASYSNSGDTYASTILYVYDTGNYRLTTLGDFVEAYERRHARLP
jgi:hypothetical protein